MRKTSSSVGQPRMASAHHLYEHMRRRAELKQAYEENGPRQWWALRELYKDKDQYIRQRWPFMSDPYPFDWRFTPIEDAAWQAIRPLGLPLYPQYPVGRFFVDFGDPVINLAIECDGKDWHDAAKDKARDAEIHTLGWTVKRFTGRQCYLPADHPESLDAWLEGLCWSHYRRAA